MYTGCISSEPCEVKFDFFFGKTSAIDSGFYERSSIPAVLCPFKCFVFFVYSLPKCFVPFQVFVFFNIYVPFPFS